MAVVEIVAIVPVNRKELKMVNRELKQELNELSKEVFGSSSRWHKLVTQGYAELLTEEVTEFVPGEKEGDEGTTRKVSVPKLHKGIKQSVTRFHTVESVHELMKARKAMLDQIRAEMKKAQEEKEAKAKQAELTKNVHEELSGSAV